MQTTYLSCLICVSTQLFSLHSFFAFSSSFDFSWFILLISFFCWIVVSKARWSQTLKTLKMQHLRLWKQFSLKCFLQSCWSSFLLFFSIFLLFFSILLSVFLNYNSIFLFYHRIHDASRFLSRRIILLMSFTTLFSSSSSFLIYKVSLSCSFSHSFLFWFSQNSLKAHWLRFNCSSTSRRSRSFNRNNLNKLRIAWSADFLDFFSNLLNILIKYCFFL